VCNGEGNFKYIYRDDNKVAPMPNHHLVKGYRTSGHKALPILDPGIKRIVNNKLASDIFRTQWMQKKMYLDLTETEVQVSNQPLYRWGYLAFGTVDVQCET